MSRNDLAAITCYFNPHHYENRKKNYKLFKDRLERQDVPCLTVECVLGDDLPELDPGPDMITVRTKDSLWQKERLLNVALDNLSPTYSKVTWLDCDVLFMDYLWARKTSDLLDKHSVIQPFNRVAFLTPEGPESTAPRKCLVSFAAALPIAPTSTRHGHTGFAWAAQRDLLYKHRLYDASILGHGDHLIGHAVHGDWATPCIKYHLPTQEFYDHFCEWARPFYQDVKGKPVSLFGGIEHLWHGELIYRRYRQRHTRLKEFEFDPRVDIVINSQGAWEWASDKPEMHQFVGDYFGLRREDG